MPRLEGDVPETLDPDDWDQLRELGHIMLDHMFTHLQQIRNTAVWQPMPIELRTSFSEPPPEEGLGAAGAYRDFQQLIMPYTLGNVHPRFWGWVMGTGSASGMLAEMLRAGINSNVIGGQQAPAMVETQVLAWFSQLLGFSSSPASGVLTEGCSEANLLGLAVARAARFPEESTRVGLARMARLPTLYCSTETHNSVDKAAALLGLGTAGVHKVPVGPDYRLDTQQLRRRIQSDRQEGKLPFCIIGNAGTVNTGALDDLEAIAEIAQEENLWFHVDGAFGALAALSDRQRHRLRGLGAADSLAFDLHKWMYSPYGVAALLVRDSEIHKRAFSVAGAYLNPESRGPASGDLWFSNLGIELSRGFRALKVWFLIKEHGYVKFARLIDQNIDQAGYLTDRIAASPYLELAAPTSLNVVCFRVRDAMDVHLETRELLLQIQERGIAVPTGTVLDGRYTIRVAITNHRSAKSDLDMLVATCEDLIRTAAGEG